jgi:hypothetical protein
MTRNGADAMMTIQRRSGSGQGFRSDPGLGHALGRASILAVSLGLLLGACAGADRFGSGGPFATRGSAAVSSPELPSAPPIATSPVESQALPPPGGAQVSGAGPGGLPPPADPFFQPSAPATPPPAPRTIEHANTSGWIRPDRDTRGRIHRHRTRAGQFARWRDWWLDRARSHGRVLPCPAVEFAGARSLSCQCGGMRQP